MSPVWALLPTPMAPPPAVATRRDERTSPESRRWVSRNLYLNRSLSAVRQCGLTRTLEHGEAAGHALLLPCSDRLIGQKATCSVFSGLGPTTSDRTTWRRFSHQHRKIRMPYPRKRTALQSNAVTFHQDEHKSNAVPVHEGVWESRWVQVDPRFLEPAPVGGERAASLPGK
jgi:hypothetical protein